MIIEYARICVVGANCINHACCKQERCLATVTSSMLHLPIMLFSNMVCEWVSIDVTHADLTSTQLTLRRPTYRYKWRMILGCEKREEENYDSTQLSSASSHSTICVADHVECKTKLGSRHLAPSAMVKGILANVART